jgi:hypothetical protein
MVDKPVLVDVMFTAGKVFENLRCERQSPALSSLLVIPLESPAALILNCSVI